MREQYTKIFSISCLIARERCDNKGETVRMELHSVRSKEERPAS